MACIVKPVPRSFPIVGKSDCCPSCGQIYVGPVSGYSDYCRRCEDYVQELGGEAMERRRAMRRHAHIERLEYLRSLWPLVEVQPNLADRLRDLM